MRGHVELCCTYTISLNMEKRVLAQVAKYTQYKTSCFFLTGHTQVQNLPAHKHKARWASFNCLLPITWLTMKQDMYMQ